MAPSSKPFFAALSLVFCVCLSTTPVAAQGTAEANGSRPGERGARSLAPDLSQRVSSSPGRTLRPRFTPAELGESNGGAGTADPSALVPSYDAPSVELEERTETKRVQWSSTWGRAGLFEAGLGVGSLAMGLGMHGVVGETEYPRWNGGILMDNAMGNMLIGKTQRSRDFAGGLSDVLLYGLIGLPVVDAGLVAGLGHGNWDVAGQLGLIALQSVGLTTGIVSIMKTTIGRKRPAADGDTLSFPSGHSALAFTGAGLICSAHGHLDLYGDGFLNSLPCVLAGAAAVTTATMRIAAERHYFSDVLVGAVLGISSGYVLPKLAYFRTSVGGREIVGAVRPNFQGDAVGLKLKFRF